MKIPFNFKRKACAVPVWDRFPGAAGSMVR